MGLPAPGARLVGRAGKVEVDGPPLALRPKHALALGMILHELVTNAVKYGALSMPKGRIFIQSSWTKAFHAKRKRIGTTPESRFLARA